MEDSHEGKRRRACDKCRTQKIKCSPSTTGDSMNCTNCVMNGISCTYLQPAPKRAPRRVSTLDPDAVKSIAALVNLCRQVLERLAPDTDFTNELLAILNKNDGHSSKRSRTTSSPVNSPDVGIIPGPNPVNPILSPIRPEMHLLSHGNASHKPPTHDLNVDPGHSLTSTSNIQICVRIQRPEGHCHETQDVLDHLPVALRQPMILFDNTLSSETADSGTLLRSDEAETDDGHVHEFHDGSQQLRLITSSVDSMTASLNSLSIKASSQWRFFGKSSSMELVHRVMDLKNGAMGLEAPRRLQFLDSRRREFWFPRPWEPRRLTTIIDIPDYEFPEPDLLKDLVELYWKHSNPFYPLLHRPTFESAIANGLHLTHIGFATNLLLVISIGARYSEDPRVLLEGTDSFHSAGWKWFNLTRSSGSLFSAPSLYELQYYCLAALFMQTSSIPQSCWTLAGVGLRLAQDMGVHRRHQLGASKTPEDELWIRAFWTLMVIDHLASCFMGRAPALAEEDFDAEMPVEVDDEYWIVDKEDPSANWKQPPGKPSTIAYFNAQIRLSQIMAITLRTIYSLNKTKMMMGFVHKDGQGTIVTQLDSALNNWTDQVPDHLRWDPHREDGLFAEQSLTLYGAFYHLQILVHRPFLTSPDDLPSNNAFPSLAICTQAARACSHLYGRRSPTSSSYFPNPHLCHRPHDHLPAFTAAIVLLLNIWGDKRTSGLRLESSPMLADVGKCMDFLKRREDRWQSSGKLWDTLNELVSQGGFASPSQVEGSRKRAREDDLPESPSTSWMNPSSWSLPEKSAYIPPDILGRVFLDELTSTSTQSQAPYFDPQIDLMSDLWSNVPFNFGFDDWDQSQDPSRPPDAGTPFGIY